MYGVVAKAELAEAVLGLLRTARCGKSRGTGNLRILSGRTEKELRAEDQQVVPTTLPSSLAPTFKRAATPMYLRSSCHPAQVPGAQDRPHNYAFAAGFTLRLEPAAVRTADIACTLPP